MMNKPEAQLAGSAFFQRLGLFWATFFYTSLAIGLLDVALKPPGIISLPGGLALAGCLAAGALFQRLFVPLFVHGGNRWPMRGNAAWIYFGGQALIAIGLIQVSPAFIGLTFTLLGHTFGALPPRRWPLPLSILFLIVAAEFGVLDDLRRADLGSLPGFGFGMMIFIVIGLLISRLFYQRYQLLELVAELRTAKAAVEAASLERAELAALRERNRLARTMHDGLGHALVLVNVKLEAAERLYARDPAHGAAELEATRALVRETLSELRRSLAELRADPTLPDLSAALHRLADEMTTRSTIQLTLDLPPAEHPPPPIRTALWLIAREALTNVERHAGAQHIAIQLRRNESGWQLQITDDGCGIQPADVKKTGHFGIIGMRERAEAVGGRLQIDDAPQGGARITVWAPEAPA
jgi:signal transduction histidine kinase